MTTQKNGSCACKAIRFKAEKACNNVGACHCSTCRKWVGGPLLAVDCGSDVIFEGKEHIGIFASSEWAERGFCKSCGSGLFYRLKANNQYIIPAGLFEDQETLVLDHQVFIDEKPAYYSFSQKTEDMTGPELFAKFGA